MILKVEDPIGEGSYALVEIAQVHDLFKDVMPHELPKKLLHRRGLDH